MPTPTEYLPPPPDVMATVNALIAAYFPELANARMQVLVRDTPLDAGEGKETVAATGVNSDAGARFEYVLWFAWDVWQILDGKAREAVVFHELMHCDRDEAGRPQLRPHDESVFTREVELYGAWWANAQQQFKQFNAQKGGKE